MKSSGRIWGEVTARKMKRKGEEIVIDHILQIAKCAGALNLDQSVTHRARMIFREASDKGALRKVNMCAVHLACIYIAAKQLHKMKTMEELVASVSESHTVRKSEIFRVMKFIQQNSPAAAFSTDLSVGFSTSSSMEEKEIDKFAASESVRAHLDHLSQLLKSSNSADWEMVECAEKMATEAIQNLGVCNLRASARTQAATLLWICSHFVENKEAADVNLVAHYSVGKYTIRSAFNELTPYLQSLFPQYLISGDLLEKIYDSSGGSRH